MKASKSLEITVKNIITNNESEHKLNHPVTVKIKQYIGFNYNTNEHEYVMLDWHITEVLRSGKRGVVFVSDGINQWRPSELSDSECEAIMKELA